MKKDELLHTVTELVKLTDSGKIRWDIQCQTTEYNDPGTKPTEKDEEGIWTIDEVFVSYHCKFKGEEFLMITYEQIYTCGDKIKTINLVFMPPLSIRFFDVDILAPYAVETDQVILYEIRALWMAVITRYKSEPDTIKIDANRRELVLS